MIAGQDLNTLVVFLDHSFLFKLIILGWLLGPVLEIPLQLVVALKSLLLGCFDLSCFLAEAKGFRLLLGGGDGRREEHIVDALRIEVVCPGFAARISCLSAQGLTAGRR